MSFNSNVFKIGSTNEQVKNYQQCKVVINSPYTNDMQVKYPPEQMQTESQRHFVPEELRSERADVPKITERNITLEQDTSFVIGDNFYKTLSHILSNILAKQDAKLIANIWDRTGNIILNGTELCNIIAALCNIDVNAVSIVYGDEEPGCLTKIKPLKNILNIKIDNKDFKLFYNEPYNILQDEFRISLTNMIIA